jgi:sulfate/thiosulfate transport system substrate-binding protein
LASGNHHPALLPSPFSAVAKKHETALKPLRLFIVDEVFGNWKAAQKKHFDDGGKLSKIFPSLT